ncbi:MAG: leucine--tRNA ligase [Alphaproteobacteria bacterium]|nr:leucine--tRNA ligase [Alphaproteobacteria bacterium]
MSEHRYDPATIEPKWQSWWEEHRTFEVTEDTSKPKFYGLVMFPYPSGSGLHVGHPLSYTAADIICRYKRQRGFSVLHPMGYDAFGLPAERAAMRTGRHPREITAENIAYFTKQLKRLGLSYDWSREVRTSEPDYYRWTQWIFLKLHEQGLAYLDEVAVNWCPAQGTVLANEEVQDGVYTETGDPVERRLMKQWMLRITHYAQRLLDDLEGLDWPEGVLEMQRQWIGRSEGARVAFQVDGTRQSFEVYTTRPDTLFGATYCVLAPEHPLVGLITPSAYRSKVMAYVEVARNKSDMDRQVAAEKEKTGVFTGAWAVNPVTLERIPIWVADYVLASYGTGAIMAVPAHDERDHAFAKKFGLEIIEVIQAPKGHDVQEAAWTGDGVAVNSGEFDGLRVGEFKPAIIAWLEKEGVGKGEVQYKLRDWLFSRQRYWGEPFPILIGEDGEVRTVPEDQLPVTLPHIDEYKPTEDGDPPLARAGDAWLTVELDGKRYRRETNTMPQWAGSCWYYLRYMDPTNTELPVSPEREKFWGPVDLYIGGVEHAVLHLLYARFWHKVLYDIGLVHTKEPFQKLFNQGMILAYAYRAESGKYYTPDSCERRVDAPTTLVSSWSKEPVETDWYHAESGTPVERKLGKMGKSLANSVDPLDIIADFGADTLRVYEMFMGPLDKVKPWDTQGCEGVHRFLSRAWRLVVDTDTGALNGAISDSATASPELRRALHLAIKEVSEGIEELRFNTPVSRMMEYVNLAMKAEALPRADIEAFVILLASFAPHLGEELWARLGHEGGIADVAWPEHDPEALVEQTVTIAVQVMGKLRGQIDMPKDAAKEDILAAAKELPNVARFLEGMELIKEIYVPGRLVNLVAKPAAKPAAAATEAAPAEAPAEAVPKKSRSRSKKKSD